VKKAMKKGFAEDANAMLPRRNHAFLETIHLIKAKFQKNKSLSTKSREEASNYE
jgi:hypothetical protein